MMGPTHLICGAACGVAALRGLELIGAPLPAHPVSDIMALGMGIVGGLLPDIDHPPAMAAHPGAQMKKLAYAAGGVRKHSLVGLLLAPIFWLTDLPVQLLSHIFAARLGHRGIMHSLGAGLIWAALFGLMGYAISGAAAWPVWVFAFAGYVSHLATDGLTITSQPIFFPLAWEAKVVRRSQGREVKRKRRVQLVPLPTAVNLLPRPFRLSASSGFANAAVSVVGFLLLLGMAAAPYFSFITSHLGLANPTGLPR